jgi:RNA polymerase sigma-70 factor (ECF subfamily)
MGASTTARLAELADEELIQGARDATKEIVKKIVSELARRHHAKLVSFLYGIVRDRTSAEDLAQEAFVRVYRHAGDYKPVAKFTTWLFAIGRNLALNEMRDRKRRPTLALNSPIKSDTSETEAVSTMSGETGATPQEEAHRNEVALELRRAVAELPEPFRVVLVLCDLEQLSYQEAAVALEVPIGTVRSRLSRARAHLEERLRRHLGSVA